MNFNRETIVSSTRYQRERRGYTLVIASIIACVAICSAIGLIFVALGGISDSHFSSNQVNCNNPCIIRISSSGFDDGQSVVVARGTAILWYNLDSSSHALFAIGNWSLNTGVINSGQVSKTTTFLAAGTYDYYCAISMIRGEIVVD